MENKERTFEEIVRSLTAKELILTMVRGLEAERFHIDMGSYGHVAWGTCFGCAATSAVLEIAVDRITPKDACSVWTSLSNKLGCSTDYLKSFEKSVDYIRSGTLRSYNASTERVYAGLPLIEYPENITLPALTSYSWKRDLETYRKLAEYQETKVW